MPTTDPNLAQGCPETRLGAESDDMLLDRIAWRRDCAAFESFLNRHHKAGFTLAFNLRGDRHLAEEAVQEALLDIWGFAARFRGGSARAWFLGMVTRKCSRMKRRLGSPAKSEVLDQRPDPRIPQDQAHEMGEMIRGMHKLLRRLPDPDRRLLALHYEMGLSRRQISEELGIPARTVSARHHRILARLRSQLSHAGLPPGVCTHGDAALTISRRGWQQARSRLSLPARVGA